VIKLNITSNKLL